MKVARMKQPLDANLLDTVSFEHWHTLLTDCSTRFFQINNHCPEVINSRETIHYCIFSSNIYFAPKASDTHTT